MCLFSLFFHSVLVFLFLFCSFFLLLCCSFFLVPLSTPPLSCFVAEPSMESWVLPITAGPMTETQKLSFTVWHWPLLLPTCMLLLKVSLHACDCCCCCSNHPWVVFRKSCWVSMCPVCWYVVRFEISITWLSCGLSISREKFSVLMKISSAWLLWIQNLIVLLQHFVD